MVQENVHLEDPKLTVEEIILTIINQTFRFESIHLLSNNAHLYNHTWRCALYLRR